MKQYNRYWVLLTLLSLPYLAIFIAVFDSILSYVLDRTVVLFSWPSIQLYILASSIMTSIFRIPDEGLTHLGVFAGFLYPLCSVLLIGLAVWCAWKVSVSRSRFYWQYVAVSALIVSLPYFSFITMGRLSTASYDREKQDTLTNHTQLNVQVGAAQISGTTLSVPISIVGLETEYEPYYVAIGLRQRNPYRSFLEHHFTASSEDGNWMLETWNSERYSAENFTVSFSDETALPDAEKLEISIALQTKFAQFYSEDFPLQTK